MPARLRVVVVGTTLEDAARLQAALEMSEAVLVDAVRIVTVLGGRATLGDPGEGYDSVVLTPQAAARLASASTVPDPPSRPWRFGAAGSDREADINGIVEPLTGRERDVLALLAGGARNAAIADALGMSAHTVKFHLAAIFGKLGVSTRTAAVRRGLRLGLIEM